MKKNYNVLVSVMIFVTAYLLEKDSLDSILVLIKVAVVLIPLIAAFFSNKDANQNSKKSRKSTGDSNKNSKKSIKSTESNDSKQSKESKELRKIAKKKYSKKDLQELVFIVVIIEEDSGISSSDENLSEDQYFSEYEYPSQDEYLSEDMDTIHYPFEDIDLNVRTINGANPIKPLLTWSLGKVYSIIKDTEGKVLSVWVQIYLYYPAPMPTPFFIRCRLSEDLTISSDKDYFVLLEYGMKADSEAFLNRTFTIIFIESL